MIQDVVQLANQFISIPTVTSLSNLPIIEHIQTMLEESEWEIERTDYTDRHGVRKGNIVAKIGAGESGLAFCSHVDTVPGQEQDWPAFTPEIREGKLYGRGSCDMKGPLAATLVAALAIDPQTLKKPIYMVITADEEWGLEGAKYLAQHSVMLKNEHIRYGVIAEPTCMVPVYSHKGFCSINVMAKGKAAHSSTGLGISALMKATPFMNDLVEIDQLIQTDSSFLNPLYTPPHHTINFIVDTGEAATNVTAPFANVKIS
ncbi:MAG: M20/M25/M40 family metallo-hydrolase, partial [Chloroflexota bacterium]